jgi:cold shock CspA family protein
MREQSIVVNWNTAKRIGHIQNPDPAERDIFVHRQNLIGRQRLIVGEIVEYDLSSNGKGLMAVNVVVIESKAASVPEPAAAVSVPAIATQIQIKEISNEQPSE